MRQIAFLSLLVPLALCGSGCIRLKTDPIEVKPIHMTVDINVRIERAVDDFFGDLDKKSTTINPK